MKEPAAVLAVGRAPRGVLKGRRLLVSVALAWLVTVVGMALMSFSLIGLLGALILILSPVPWLRPLWLLPKSSGRAPFAAPFLLFAVPVVLVSSAFMMAESLRSASYQRNRASERALMMKFEEGLPISAGGGALAAMLDILGLYCWTRRMPAQRWSIALLLALFGPAVAGAIYFFAALGIFSPPT